MKQTRADALRQMDISETPMGKRTSFSIKFIKKDGEIVYLPRAVKAGLRMNLSKNRFRGVVPVDNDFNATAHIYPVHIDNITEFNEQPVIL